MAENLTNTPTTQKKPGIPSRKPTKEEAQIEKRNYLRMWKRGHLREDLEQMTEHELAQFVNREVLGLDNNETAYPGTFTPSSSPEVKTRENNEQIHAEEKNAAPAPVDGTKSGARKKTDWFDVIFKILKFAFIVGIIAFCLWMFNSCEKEQETKRRTSEEEHDAEIYKRAKDEVWDQVTDELPPLQDILWDAYYPDDLESDLMHGNISFEDAIREYRKLYEAFADAVRESDLYG